jgi:hypothetical protein
MIKVALAAPVVAGFIGGLGLGTAQAETNYQRGYNFVATHFAPTTHPIPGAAFMACNNVTTGLYYHAGNNTWDDGATDFLQGCMAGAAQKGWQ